MQKKIDEFGIIRKILFGLLILCISVSAMFMFLPTIVKEPAKGNETIINIAGIVGFFCFALFITLLILLFTKTKKTLSKESYKKSLFVKVVYGMLGKEEQILSSYEPKDSEQYKKIKKLFNELGPLMNKYSLAVLGQPIRFTKPRSTHSAAIIGSAIGGPALGMVYAQEAAVKMQQYKENENDVMHSQVVVNDAEKKVMDTYQNLYKLLCQCDKTYEIITKIEEEEDKKIRKEYTVTSLWYYW